MLFDRQKSLLALVDTLGESVRGLDFQKLLFLYCNEAGGASAYEFVPYRFGGFSFTSYADKRRLIERGLLVDEEHAWTLTPAGKTEALVTMPVRVRMRQFAQCYAGLRGDALVAEAYRRYPYYAIRSEMAEGILAGDAATLAAIAEARPTTGQAGLCTIGYEGRSLEGYLNCLIADGVTILCDVRRNAISRKYGFSKRTLSNACKGVGIRYEHLPDLGIASEKRQGIETQADYDALFEEYERMHLPKQSDALASIRAWAQEGARVALTCYERLPSQCHRHCVGEALEQKFGVGFAPQHL